MNNPRQKLREAIASLPPELRENLRQAAIKFRTETMYTEEHKQWVRETADRCGRLRDTLVAVRNAQRGKP